MDMMSRVKVEEPRQPGKVKFPLLPTLFGIVIAWICGYNSAVHVAEFLNAKKRYLNSNKELEKMIGSLKILCKDQKKVVAVSTLPASALTESLTAINQVMQDLAVNFEVVESCKVQEVNEADKVFILEKIDQSKLAAVVDEVNLVKNFSHNLLGVIYA